MLFASISVYENAYWNVVPDSDNIKKGNRRSADYNIKKMYCIPSSSKSHLQVEKILVETSTFVQLRMLGQEQKSFNRKYGYY